MSAQRETNSLLRELINRPIQAEFDVSQLSQGQLGHPVRVGREVSETVIKAVRWLLGDDNRMNMSVREAERASGMSKSTIHRARILIESGDHLKYVGESDD